MPRLACRSAFCYALVASCLVGGARAETPPRPAAGAPGETAPDAPQEATDAEHRTLADEIMAVRRAIGQVWNDKAFAAPEGQDAPETGVEGGTGLPESEIVRSSILKRAQQLSDDSRSPELELPERRQSIGPTTVLRATARDLEKLAYRLECSGYYREADQLRQLAQTYYVGARRTFPELSHSPGENGASPGENGADFVPE